MDWLARSTHLRSNRKVDNWVVNPMRHFTKSMCKQPVRKFSQQTCRTATRYPLLPTATIGKFPGSGGRSKSAVNTGQDFCHPDNGSGIYVPIQRKNEKGHTDAILCCRQLNVFDTTTYTWFFNSVMFV